MKICSLCGTTHDDRVDFCFRDGTPLQPVTDDTDVPESPLREALPEVGPPGAADPLDAPEPASMRFDDVPEPMGLKGVLPEISSDLPEPQHVPTNVEVPTGLSESPTIPVPMDQAKPFLEAEPVAEQPVVDEADEPAEPSEPDEPVEDVAQEEPEPVAGMFGGADDDLDFPDEPSDDWAPPIDDDPPPEKKSMLPIFGGLIAVVLIGGVGAVLFMNSGGEEPDPTPEPTVAEVADVAPEPAPAPVVEEPVVEEPVVEEPVEEPVEDAVADAEEPTEDEPEPEPVVERQPTRSKAKAKSSSAERAAPADDPWGSSGEDVQPANVSLRVRTEPAGATVFVDGRSVGPSPATVEVEPGRHDVRAELAGYTTSSIATMAEGSATDALLTLKKEGPAKAAVTLFGPAGAQVFLGGASIGYLPVQTELSLGSHEFKVVTAEGTFYKVTQSVTADGGSLALLPN